MTFRADAAGDALPAAREVRLRPWHPDEADWYLAALDAEIVHWTRESPAMGRDACVAAHQGAAGPVDQRALAVVGPDDSPLGNLAISVTRDEAELSYWIAAESRGRGAATAALVAGTELALSDPRVTSCLLLIHPANEASIRVARRAGYRFVRTQPGPPECSNDAGLVAAYRYPPPDPGGDPVS